MPHRQNRLKPTRINTRYIEGVVYHYDKVADEFLKSLGIDRLPPQGQGKAVKVDGLTIRRLKSGLLNVTVWPWSKLLRDKAADRFMAALLDPGGREGATTARQELG